MWDRPAATDSAPWARSVFLRTKVARRVLTLFMVGALLPTVVLAAIGFVYVTRELHEQAKARLHQASKSAGMVLLERLESFDTELDVLATSMRSGGVPPNPAARHPHLSKFAAVAVQYPDKPPLTLLGALAVPPPERNEAQRRHLGAGRALVIIPNLGTEPAILIGRRVEPSDRSKGLLWGQIEPSALWSMKDDDATLGEGMGLCLFPAALDRPLYCTEGMPVPSRDALRIRPGTSGDAWLSWSRYGEDYVSISWPVFLGFSYGAAPWQVVLTQSTREVLAPAATFRRTFAAIVLLALVVVFLLSNLQIRRSMEPLVKLEEATHRIAAGEFDHAVTVDSGDEFERLADSFSGMSRRLGKQFTALATIHDIDRSILAALEPEAVIDTVLTRLPHLIPGDEVSVTVAASDAGGGWRRIVLADGQRVVEEVRISAPELQELHDHRDHLLLNGGAVVRGYLGRRRDLPLGGALVLPLFQGRDLTGTIAVGYRSSPRVGPEDIAQGRLLADQIAVAFSNTRLIQRLDQLSWGTLRALARTIDANSPWTAGHSERVTRLALRIGVALGLGQSQLETLHRGGLLHDIGKIGIPGAILDKPGSLTDEEMRLVREHPSTGARILTPIAAYADVIPIVLHHHEMYDGTGYPTGLAGEGIPLLARVLTVADVYDALVSDRPYRSGWDPVLASEFLERQSGTHFDPVVVRAGLQLLREPEPEAPAARASTPVELVTASWEVERTRP